MADMSAEEIKQAVDLLRDPGSAGLTEEEIAYLADMVSNAAKAFVESNAAGPITKTATAAFDALNYLGGLQDLGWGVAAGGVAEALGTGKFKDVVRKEDVLAALNPADLTIATDPGTYFQRAGMSEEAALPAGIIASIIGPGLITKLPRLGGKVVSSFEQRLAKQFGGKKVALAPETVRKVVPSIVRKIATGKEKRVLGPQMTRGRIAEAMVDPIGLLSENLGERALRHSQGGLDLTMLRQKVLPASDVIVDEARNKIFPRFQTPERAAQTISASQRDLENAAKIIERDIVGNVTPKEIVETIKEMAARGASPEEISAQRSKMLAQATLTDPVTNFDKLFGPTLKAYSSDKAPPGIRSAGPKAVKEILSELKPHPPWMTTNIPPAATTRVSKSGKLVGEKDSYTTKVTLMPLIGETFQHPVTKEIAYYPGVPHQNHYTLSQLINNVRPSLQNIARQAGEYKSTLLGGSKQGLKESVKGEIASKMARDVNKVIEAAGETRKPGLGAELAKIKLRQSAGMEAEKEATRLAEQAARRNSSISIPALQQGVLDIVGPGTIGRLMMSQVGRRMPRAGITSALGGYSAAPSQEELDMRAIIQELEKYKK